MKKFQEPHFGVDLHFTKPVEDQSASKGLTE